MRASGTICCRRMATISMSLTRLWTKKICPSRFSSRMHRVADQLGLEARHARLDGQAVVGRRFQVRNVAHAQQRHVQRARNRRGGHRQHVDRLPQRLEPFLDLHAEPLLFVDDHQAQIVERARRAAPADACR